MMILEHERYVRSINLAADKIQGEPMRIVIQVRELGVAFEYLFTDNQNLVIQGPPGKQQPASAIRAARNIAILAATSASATVAHADFDIEYVTYLEQTNGIVPWPPIRVWKRNKAQYSAPKQAPKRLPAGRKKKAKERRSRLRQKQ